MRGSSAAAAEVASSRMRPEPFLLDRWLEQKHGVNGANAIDLASSTGPAMTLWELLEVAGAPGFLDELRSTRLVYAPADGAQELREAIADFEGTTADNVLVCTGAAEALTIMLVCAAGSRANIVCPDPDFPAITALARSLGIEVRHYRLSRDRGFQLDVEAATSLVDANTRLLLIISPHNPTGAVVPDGARAALHDFCAARNLSFVCDQVYHPVYHTAGTVPPGCSASALPAATVIGDCSKALSLSGLRIGWIIEPDRSRREGFVDARAYISISSTALGERLATLALRHRERILSWARRETSGSLELLDGFFHEHADHFGWVRPAGGYTAFPWLLRESCATPFCHWLLRDRGIMVAPGECFRHPSHFRMGFGAGAARVACGIERLDAAVRDYFR
ncbi:MAG TPA: pyridoxal phosphate-dependent aminotransferase [Steroidobacteraceae bacterium]|nr:pyridoxal phosphate-dependent aminotransferase [Steroidobacteraceae bacterium]